MVREPALVAGRTAEAPPAARAERSVEPGRWGERIVYRLADRLPEVRRLVQAHRYLKQGGANGLDRDAHRDAESRHTGLNLRADGREWSFPDDEIGRAAAANLEAVLAAAGVVVERVE